jgi:glycosyltransferase involved in cell wall biosynthesis
MKILYLCPDLGIPVLGRKGAAVHVREMVAAFRRAGHATVLAAQMVSKSPWEKPAEMAEPPWQVRPNPNAAAAVLALREFNELLGVQNSLPGELRRILYNKEMLNEIRRRFENEPPDFIYERASLYATAGVTLAREFGVPCLLELNAPLAVEQAAYRATGFGELGAVAERWTISQADAVVVVSAALREHALACGAKPERVQVIPNGINPALFCPAPREEAVRARWHLDGGPVIGFVGGLRPWHGIEALPDLLECLGRKHPGVRLVIAGDGPLRAELERALDQRGLRGKAVITGPLAHEEVPPLIRQFDLALAPYSPADHPFYFSPLKLFEYMACGIAVVVPRLGQIAEVVEDGETGLLYPAGDAAALADCCHRLLADPTRRSELGRNAARVVRERFTWDANAARVVEMARNLVGARSG